MNLKKVKSRLKDEKLDLSLCDLKEVPIREIATIKKATHLDLSNNLLTSLSSTFVDLKQIVILDLSRNMLTEIPENFGELRRLKHLDLYANQISRLPLSLSELKSLRWLDLKENPLTPAVASVAGPCSNLSECQACARNIVSYLSNVKLAIEEEKLRRLNAITDTETGIVSKKKGGRKKKKKILDKNNKQNLDENGSNWSSKVSLIDENKMAPLITTHNRNQGNKTYGTKGNAHRFFMFMISSALFLCGSAFVLMIVILPSYSKQPELFIDYIESKAGIHLKVFQKYSTDAFDSFIQAMINIYDNLYHMYEKNFKTDMNIPANK